MKSSSLDFEYQSSSGHLSLLERDIEYETTRGGGQEKFLNALVPYAILNLVGE